MEVFISNFNGTSTPNLSLFSVVAEFVPTSFQPTPSTVYSKLEAANGLKLGSITEVKPLKDLGYWKPGQHFAHFMFSFSDQCSANRAIFNDLVIEGARVQVQKFLPEPTRCLHCQQFGHFPQECKAGASVCVHCAGCQPCQSNTHTTAACTVSKGDFSAHHCANCGVTGHGAAAHSCKIFARRLWVFYNHSDTVKYVGFPSADPKTWRLSEKKAPWGISTSAWATAAHPI
ncbi:hypothetical protein BDQ17DRAFT_1261304 [Cyathus striatus]|nr:hypothetical protein BDQ17DRAFT_1261304 [Cyathus striatus]